ncbi:hypothetical protein V2I01_29910 [Micromonospora sp. BRA006-A]|nr:hypothetical protein [Micromonospora sp. BRA006-A]
MRFVGTAGRWLSYGAILLGVGGLVFALTTLVGTRSDIRLVQVWVRIAGLAVVAGVLLELAALAAVFGGGGVASAVSVQALTALGRTPVAAGLGLRFAGAAGLLVAGSLEAALIRGRHAVGRHAVVTVAAIPTALAPGRAAHRRRERRRGPAGTRAGGPAGAPRRHGGAAARFVPVRRAHRHRRATGDRRGGGRGTPSPRRCGSAGFCSWRRCCWGVRASVCRRAPPRWRCGSPSRPPRR